jgi:peroxiredoxin
MKLLNSFILGVLSLASASAIEVGDSIPPSVELHFGFPPEKIEVAKRIAGKKVILVGLPGAFTPTWSSRQVPGYLANLDAISKLGVDEVIIYCVNDGAVMEAWASDQGISNDSIIKLMGDPYGELTEKLQMELTHAGPKSKGLINRSKRFALYIEDGTVKVVRVAESDEVCLIVFSLVMKLFLRYQLTIHCAVGSSGWWFPWCYSCWEHDQGYQIIPEWQRRTLRVF